MPTDRQLLARILTRDQSAFDGFYARHREVVRKRLVGMLRDESAADDLLQKVFLRVWTRAGQWAQRGSARNWLLRIATNLALNHLRSAKRHRSQPLEIRQENPEDDYEAEWLRDLAVKPPEELAETAELLEAVGQLVEQLPAGKQRVLRMVYQQQMELQAVAEQLNIPVGTVKSRLHYATRQLAQMLARLEGSDE